MASIVELSDLYMCIAGTILESKEEKDRFGWPGFTECPPLLSRMINDADGPSLFLGAGIVRVPVRLLYY